MKYSAANERDFKFYLRSRHDFAFSGSEVEHTIVSDKSGMDGKKAFFSIDNTGKNIPTKHPNLLHSLLKTKASVNFQVKQWAESRADGILPLILFSKRTADTKYPELEIYKDLNDVVDIETEFNLPGWVINAVENQKKHFVK